MAYFLLMKQLLFACLIGLLLIAGCTKPPQTPQTHLPPEANGTLRLSLTDQQADSEYESIWVTINGIEVHMGNEWQTVFEGSKTFDLLKLNGIKTIIGETELRPGKYTQVRLNVSKVELVEEEETEPVMVPSEKIKLVKNFEIMEGQTTELVIDFNPYSIVVEGDKYILKPVIRVLTVAEFEQKAADEKREREETVGEKQKPKITQLSFPSTAESGETIDISWRVSGGKTGTIEQTALYWDITGGHAEKLQEYANSTQTQAGNTPKNFSTQLKLPTVTSNSSVFFRVHAIVDGEQVYSPEQKISISNTLVQPQIQEFNIRANDSRFEPDSIEVTNGNIVKITFTVDTSNVSFGGLDIKSSEFETGTIKPGESKQVSFTATKSFTVTGYWPSSQVRKGDLQITVK